MHYVSVEGLTKSYGINPLFSNISFHINEGDKIALIARNGIGKSTMLRILAGLETPDAGKYWIHKDVTVALFEQDPQFEESWSVLENIFHLNHPVITAIKKYEAAIEAEDAIGITEGIEAMDDLSAWDFEAKVKQILDKLNIHHLTNPVKELSGGQRKRVALAKTLIDIGFAHQHTLLMMDEPTNHLDVEMIEWLEHYLNQEKVTLLLVSHDRYFLDATCDEIWELERENLYVYRGDYEQYMEQKAARLESEQASIDKAKNTYRKELEWMRKQPKARTTKSKSRQDNFYEVEARAKQKIEDAQLQLQVKMSRLGGKVVEMKKVYKSYGDLPILQGLESADSGKINIGDTVVFGNFSQQGLVFKENVRVIEYVKGFAENFPLADGTTLSAAQFLELFLFTPDKQYTYLNSLSGGEKKRLQLLVVLFTNPNFLILDEPTNDLDLPTLAVLENFLVDYPGCVLIVSHDRYFMDRLVDHLFVFEGNAEVRDFPGNYSQYRIWQKENEKKDNKWDALEAGKRKGASTEDIVTAKLETPKAPVKKVMSFKEKREFEQLEKEMPLLEKEKHDLTNELSTGTASFEIIQKISERLVQIEKALEEKETRWLELSEFQ